MIIGSGPIIIGQACEFDYSGTQACKALKDEGYEVVLINSNPATIMTDPEFADCTYIEPITPEMVYEEFGKPGLRVTTDSEALFAELETKAWDHCNLLLMSSGNFDGKDLPALARRITGYYTSTL